VPWSVVNPEVLQIFTKKSKFFEWYSQIAHCVWFLTKALICLLSLTTPNELICGAIGKENMWHTCFPYVVESKIGSLGATSHTPWPRYASVCIWWMDDELLFAYDSLFSFWNFWDLGYVPLFFLSFFSFMLLSLCFSSPRFLEPIVLAEYFWRESNHGTMREALFVEWMGDRWNDGR
jgi:hypothetical protein